MDQNKQTKQEGQMRQTQKKPDDTKPDKTIKMKTRQSIT